MADLKCSELTYCNSSRGRWKNEGGGGPSSILSWYTSLLPFLSYHTVLQASLGTSLPHQTGTQASLGTSLPHQTGTTLMDLFYSSLVSKKQWRLIKFTEKNKYLTSRSNTMILESTYSGILGFWD